MLYYIDYYIYMNDLLSIVVPIFNSSEYLSRCLDSLINQLYVNVEIILIDDGSIDNSLNIAYHFATLDKRIKVYSKTNQGVSWTRNLALRYVSGKYVTFVDSDDFVDPSIYSVNIERMEKENLDIVMFNFYNEKNGKLTTGPTFYEGIYNDNKKLIESILMDFGGVCWNKIFKTSIIKDNLLFFDTKINFGEDLYFCINYCKFVKKAQISNQRYYFYNTGNMSSLLHRYFSSESKRCFNLIEVYLRLKGILNDKFYITINQKIIESAGNFLFCLDTKEYPELKKEYMILIRSYYKDFSKHKKEFSCLLRIKMFCYRYFPSLIRCGVQVFKKIFK